MKYRSKETIEAVSFQELVEIALAAEGTNIVNGVPWSFEYQGWQFTHETDDLYLFSIAGETVKFRRGDFLATDVTGALWLMSAETINDHYSPANYVSSDEDRIDARDAEIGNHIRDKERLKNDIDRLEGRLQRIGDEMEKIVVTEGEDAGVVLLSTDAPKRWDLELQGTVYDLEYFSPLGEALMAVYKISRSNGGADEAGGA